MLLSLPPVILGQVSIITHHNDLGRTGQNLNETVLNTTSVNTNYFGKLFTRTVDGDIYAQPLIVSNLMIGGITRNVVYVATMHNSIFAFDADDRTGSSTVLAHSQPELINTQCG